jgi:hemoglobin-like flavoprotein
MSPAQKALVQASWDAAFPQAECLAHLFYHRLFVTMPATRALFENVDAVAQSRKLVAALTTVVQGLDDLDSLEPPLAALGSRHASYGVEDSHYDAVGAALLWAFETVLRPQWTDELKAAWTEAYDIVARTMRRAAGTNSPMPTGHCSRP